MALDLVFASVLKDEISISVGCHLLTVHHVVTMKTNIDVSVSTGLRILGLIETPIGEGSENE